MKADGTHRRTILQEGVKTPRGIAIDLSLGLMWWTDWTKRTVEIAHMDGSNRKIIADNNVDWPNGIAIDRYLLHYVYFVQVLRWL